MAAEEFLFCWSVFVAVLLLLVQPLRHLIAGWCPSSATADDGL
ncbi:MAG: hypothetical protein GPOALKHO_001521 [Sodalis sp.]|nr:MAG: hypothetical protein GPOALKHO_001521 [Sodalis sp.]